MTTTAAVRQQSLATAAEVAAALGDVSEKTLANWRSLGTGPAYVKVGRLVRYQWSAVDTWLSERTKTGAA
jgi:predicted DNA-binding transcriptional regulator AlpA